MMFVVILLAQCTVLLGEERTVVQTKDGKVRGTRMWSDLGKEVEVWESIPYAQPPLGELRFRSPVPVTPWKDVRNVTGKPNSCVQISGVSFPGHPGEKVWLYNTPISEDCLYLSITRPVGMENQPLPVMVWIYGGSYFSGTYTLELYDPKILATEMKVVVAAIQYRVASLGFLFLDTKDVPGNAGLMDQVMALRWIKENVENFGGNPNSITLFSESAGSSSVGYHLLSPLTKNLFNRAILQSASALNPWGLISRHEAKRRSVELAKKMDCPGDLKFVDNIISCLRSANATAMVNMEWNDLTFGLCSFPFVPIVDGEFLPSNPATILASANYPKREILLGANQDEGSYFLIYYLTEIFELKENITITREIFEKAVSEINLYVKPVGLSAISYMYTDWRDPHNSLYNARSLDRMSGDFQFTCPVVHFAEAFAKRDQTMNVYMYRFNHRTVNSPWPTWAGSMHGDEIAYVFGDPFRKVGAVNYTEKERLLSSDMMTYWTNFAKTGDPNKFENGTWIPSRRGVYWPVHSQTNREYLELGTTRHVNRTAFKVNECEFWKSYLPSLLKAADGPVDGNTSKKKNPCYNCRCPKRRRPSTCSCPSNSSLIFTTFFFTLISTMAVTAVL